MQVVFQNITFAVENKLVKKLDLITKRITSEHPRQNAYLENHGKPGDGKTNTAVVEAAYVHFKTGRPIHMFFKLANLLEFAKKNEDKIIIWDEPSLDSLSTDHQARINRDLTRLINMGRKLRHFYIMNFTKFWRFPEDIVVDTCLGMVHMDSHNGNDLGRFLYIGQKNLQRLWDIYQKTGSKKYAKLMAFGGRMPFILEKYFDKLDITIEGKPHCTLRDYETLKDAAIASIGGGEEKKSKKELEVERKLKELRYKIGVFASLGLINQEVIAAKLGVNSKRFREWRELTPEGTISLGNEAFNPKAAALTWDIVAKEKKGDQTGSQPLENPINNSE